MNIEQIAELRRSIESQKHDLQAPSPVPTAGQIHCLRNCPQSPQLFLLVAACYENEKYCNVIPGSFDGMHAVAPGDMILPESLLGDYAYLSMDMIRILPTAALGEGVVRLTDDIFQKILSAKDTCLAGRRQDVVAFEFSDLPYFGAADPRRAEHETMRKMILEALASVFAPEEDRTSISERIIQFLSNFDREMSLAGMSIGAFPSVLSFCDWNLFRKHRPTVLAAAPHQENPCGEWRIEGCDDVLFFEYDNDGKKLRIKCYTPANELSGTFDNWQLLDDSSRVLGTIGSGKLAVAGEMVRGIGLFLRSPDGRLFPLAASEKA